MTSSSSFCTGATRIKKCRNASAAIDTKNRRRRRRRRTRASKNDDEEEESSSSLEYTLDRPLLVIVECDGVMIDVQTAGHRVAFNEAFKKLSITSADWTPTEYATLLRSGGGTAEGMIERYFHFYGYPRADLRDEVVAEENDMESAYEAYLRRQQGPNAKEDTFWVVRKLERVHLFNRHLMS